MSETRIILMLNTDLSVDELWDMVDEIERGYLRIDDRFIEVTVTRIEEVD